MTTKTPVHLDSVPETLLIPLFGRAQENERRRPMLRDPRATELVRTLDYDFSKFEGGRSLRGAVLRTRLYDRIVERFLEEHPAGTVVELGCGLNTRFERVDNGRVRWFDLDVPEVAALWRPFFEETERRSFLPFSAFEPAWMDEVRNEGDGPYLFVSEASTLYFSEAENRRLFALLAERFPGAQVLFDTATTAFIAGQDRHDTLRHCTARVSWAVDEPAPLEAWGLRLTESFPLMRPPAWLRGEVPLRYRVLGTVLAWVRPAFVQSYWVRLAQLPS